MGTSHLPEQIGDLPRIGRPANGALLAAGITTLEQVGAAGRRRLLGMHGIGPKAVRILSEAPSESGVPFAD